MCSKRELLVLSDAGRWMEDKDILFFVLCWVCVLWIHRK